MLKKLAIAGGALIGVVALVIVGFVVFTNATWRVDYSDTPYPKLGALDDPEKIARGKYVVDNLAHCQRCHALEKDALRMRPGSYPPPAGGYEWDIPVFGLFTSPNVTPHKETGIGRYKPEAIARTLKTGVRPDGSLGVFMTMSLGRMTDEDIEAVVAYLYSVPPVERVNGPYEPALIGKVIAKGLPPRTGEPAPYAPSGEVSAKRGEYLAKGPAACVVCHTPFDIMGGMAKVGPYMSGGFQAEPDIKAPGMVMIPPNLTPHPEYGHLRDWDEAKFLERFSLPEAFVGTSMPWGSYMGMTTEDKKSLWLYLQSLPPADRDLGPPYRKADWKPGQST